MPPIKLAAAISPAIRYDLLINPMIIAVNNATNIALPIFISLIVPSQ